MMNSRITKTSISVILRVGDFSLPDEVNTYFFTFICSSKISHLILYRYFSYVTGMFITFIWREQCLRFVMA